LKPAPFLRFGSPLPPSYIHYLPQGEIEYAWRSESPHNSQLRGVASRTSAQRAGLRYQQRIEELLRSDPALVGPPVFGPWFGFIDYSGTKHWCQPDALLPLPSGLGVCEIKRAWTSDAWHQLRRLYLPVVAKAGGSERVLIPIVVCRSYDPFVRTTEATTLIPDLRSAAADQFNVLVRRR
jgi:hypothetical protein